jgi:hypothetical protein
VFDGESAKILMLILLFSNGICKCFDVVVT